MTRFFVGRPVTTWMLFAAFVVMGIYAVPRLEVEAVPELDLPSLTVVAGWNGASPKAVQRSLTRPIEEAVQGLHGVENVKSVSRAGQASVTVEFDRDIDLDFAQLELGERLGGLRRDLPLGASQPVVQAFVPEEFETENFFSVSIDSPLPPAQLREQAEDWIVPAVLAVEGVADAQVRGGALPLVEILLDRDRLDLLGISADEVFAAVRQLDLISGVGAIRQGGREKLVSLRGDVTLRGLREAVVAHRGGRNYTLGMLGEVREGHEDPQYFVRANGRNVVELQVEKRSGANSVMVSRALRDALPDIFATVPFEAGFHVEQDEGQELDDKLSELVLRSGIILLVLFLLLAISLRELQLTAIVVGSVVFALVICLSLFYFLKLSVNFITISGLTICFGMLLDNSIIVLEAIHRRLSSLDRAEEAGIDRAGLNAVGREVVVRGTGEASFPIMATTLTTVVAFGSFLFLSGRMALYYVPLAVAVGTAMLASIFVAFGWIPSVLQQTWVGRYARRHQAGDRPLSGEEELLAITEDLPDLAERPPLMQRLFAGSQRLGWVLVPALVWLGWTSWNSYQDDVIKGGFWRMPDPNELIFFMRMPDGTDVEVTSEKLWQFEQLLLPLEDGARMRSNAFGNQAFMRVEFDEPLLRTGIPLLYRSLLTERADQTGGTRIFVSGFSDTPYIKGRFGGTQLNSTIKLSGYNSRQLEELADGVLRKLDRERRARNGVITGSNRWGRSSLEETVLQIDRDALARHGVTVAELVGHLRRMLGFDVPWSMQLDGEQERVQLGFAGSDDVQYSEITSEVLTTAEGTQVRLGELVDMQVVPLSDSIERENQSYTMFVSWEYIGTDRMRDAYIQRQLAGLDLPYGYTAEESEQRFFSEEEEANLLLTLGLALLFIFLVLAALFESLSLPLLVLSSVPMALIGVVYAFAWTDTAFDSSARIGLVLLFGVVVNNAILLVSRFRREAALALKAYLGTDPETGAGLFPGTQAQLGGADLFRLPRPERGPLLRRAVARATSVRLRSILLTSGTTVVGLIPLLVGVDKVAWSPGWLFGLELPFRLRLMGGAEQDIWENLALATVGGMLSSTVLLLVVLPALYTVAVQLGWEWKDSWTGWRPLPERLRRPAGAQAP